ncbi:hypothetical protein [Geobacter sp. SVR]|uniref:hypothetical protein n=1 Tax=Geobacter sp. SVR TaxID=2495594 RepID=UPI0015656EAC|nr:hypothetical protein [Geobacter sp. SVR]
MKTSKLTITERVKALLALRGELDERVGSKADVLGSMVALKLTAGKITGRLGVTYFVREKIPKAKLIPRQRVPTKVQVGDVVVSTDVMTWPRMEEQSLQVGTILFDGRLQGTLTCFGVSQAGSFGVSCAHCLTGVDGNPATSTTVAAYASPPGQFLPIGQSVYLAYSPGIGVLDNFGYLDCGLFDLRDQVLSGRAATSQLIDLVEDIHVLVGHRLKGISALNAPNANWQVREAQVLGVEAEALGERCDVVLSVLPPGTFRGDSGMLWLTQEGQAAAIHARGEVMPGIQGSSLTTAMSAKRAAMALGVQLSIG